MGGGQERKNRSPVSPVPRKVLVRPGTVAKVGLEQKKEAELD